MLDEVIKKFDKFIEIAEQEVNSRPWLVVILMHEYYRSIYPADPYIPYEDKGSLPLERISHLLDQYIQMFHLSRHIGSYFQNLNDSFGKLLSKNIFLEDDRTDEEETQRVYGLLWDKFDANEYVKEARNILQTRLKFSGFHLTSLKGKTVLDLGCGSGRFTIALASTGATKVHGVDLGKKSIEAGAKIAEKAGLENIEFRVSSVLEVPFDDNYFDFVFCNGVLHHTVDMEKGLNELYRVLVPGCEAFIYLYADGGLFWYSRKKMPEVMKTIPQKYTMAVLDLIGVPDSRFIFSDNWYVPIERHTTKEYLENYLKKIGFSSFKKIVSGRDTDFDSVLASGFPEKKEMWGDGEHRYLLKK
jgi:ubiquinone/menaquinone biosynthesis C-methylase UbiE